MQNWSTVRKIISRGAIVISHTLLPASRTVKDITSGFFALKREVVADAELKPIGWKILLETLYMGNAQKTVEVPFMFALRTKGSSKLNSRQQIEYLKHIWSLMKRKGEHWRFLKFIGVGLSGVGVNEGVYWLLTRPVSLYDVAAQAISFEVSVISNFTLNDFFTFPDRRAPGAARFGRRLFKFNLVSLVGLGFQTGALLLFTRVIHLHDMVALLIGIILATIWNYFVNSIWTWK